MAWDDGEGPWGRPRPSSDETPGKRPGAHRPADAPQDIDDWLRAHRDRMRGMFGGGGDGGDGPSRQTWAGIAAFLFILWLLSGIYMVDTSEQGVVLRFGEYHHTTGPGLHWHLPFPVERVVTPSVTSINVVQVRSEQARSGDEDNRMLTGDLNLVDVRFDVQWKIDPSRTADFLFNVRDPAETIRPVAESVMREVIGQLPLQYIIDRGQGEIADRTEESIQRVLDAYKAGISIEQVNLLKPDVPEEVIDAYQDIKKAEQDRATVISKANRYRNQVIPTAKGEASKIEQDALAYQDRIVAEARGQAARFVSVFEEYNQARDVTRKRLYLETMEEILRDMDKIILDDNGGGGAVPYLPLKELGRNTGASQ